ncbi:hypothetical protein J2Z21_008645 [Streptomyces griseochromogenes]|uniref:Uncharacterized protein n=1 Tax=Streptomyces griseochromogenes TaxID=68214 RepID=A0ABS4M7H8_9ACTN|nr:hypothetical protein [Streptomyces griseochromogenes]
MGAEVRELRLHQGRSSWTAPRSWAGGPLRGSVQYLSRPIRSRAPRSCPHAASTESSSAPQTPRESPQCSRCRAHPATPGNQRAPTQRTPAPRAAPHPSEAPPSPRRPIPPPLRRTARPTPTPVRPRSAHLETRRPYAWSLCVADVLRVHHCGGEVAADEARCLRGGAVRDGGAVPPAQPQPQPQPGQAKPAWRMMRATGVTAPAPAAEWELHMTHRSVTRRPSRPSRSPAVRMMAWS